MGYSRKAYQKIGPHQVPLPIERSLLQDQFCGPSNLLQAQCYDTTELVKKELGLPEAKVSTSFQSRLGSDPWLQPFTDKEFERLGEEGAKKLAVITPAFVSDCLETLEEIAMEGKEQFQEAGGGDYIHIPCL